MTTSSKILLGAATAWPIIYMFVFIVTIFSTMRGAFNGGGFEEPSLMPIFVLHMFTALETLVLLVFYVVHAIRNERLDQNTRLLWAILLFVGNMVAMPIYYIMNIWPTHAEPARQAGETVRVPHSR